MSSRKFSLTDWNNRHFERVEAYARRVQLLYYSAIRDATQLAIDAKTDAQKPFDFNSYPKIKDRVSDLFGNLAVNLLSIIQLGQASEWAFSDEKNDALVESVFHSSPQPRSADNPDPPGGPALPNLDRYKTRNSDELAALQKRRVNGLNLSDRIYNYTAQFRTEVELGLDIGLGEGKSANQISRDIRSYLDEPTKLFRRVRDKHGMLALSKAAKAYSPGQGTYRSSYKNSMRLTRTEINQAYREADHIRYQTLDFVVGFEVRRSNNKTECDICESLKGPYPKTFKFVGWHPQCRCHVLSILATGDELRRLNQMVVSGEDTSSFHSENEVAQLPQNFTNWLETNRDRIGRAKSLPYFMQDNFENGNPDKPKNEPQLNPSPKKAVAIDLSKFIAGDMPTNKEIKAIITEFARLYPDNFTHGLESVSIVKDTGFLLQCSTLRNPKTNQWASKTTLSISSHDFSIGGSIFNPAEELRGAFAAMKADKPLTFNQEYAIEGLWHELLHAKSKTLPRKLDRYRIQDMETLNQFMARHTYDELMKPFGVAAVHKQAILEGGYGYKIWVADFRAKLVKRGLDENQVVEDLFPVLMGDYGQITKALQDYFKPRRP